MTYNEIKAMVHSNGWCRINEYYPDGIITEIYEK